MVQELLSGKRILAIAVAVITLNFPTFFFFLGKLAVDPSLFASAFFVVVALTLGLITMLELRKLEKRQRETGAERTQQPSLAGTALPTLPAAVAT